MKYIYFLYFALVYLVIRFAEYFEFPINSLLTNYITDLCAMPLVFGLLLLILLKINKDKYRLPLWFILGMTAYWSFYFEYYLPLQNKIYTADLVDVGMYCVGSLSFILWQKKYQKKRLS